MVNKKKYHHYVREMSYGTVRNNQTGVFPDPFWTTGVITLSRNTIIYNHEAATFDRRKSFVFFFLSLNSFSRLNGCPHPKIDMLNTCFEESFMHKLTSPIVISHCEIHMTA